MGRLKRFKKIFIVLLILLLIALGISVFFFLNSKPDLLTKNEKEKALTEILGRKANLEGDKAGNLIYSGKKASFKYPARAKVYEYVDPSSKDEESILDRLSFDIENPRLILNYTVIKNPTLNGTIQDYPAVKLREDKSRGYQQSNFEIDNEEGIAFSRPNSSEAKAEKTGFLLKDDLIYVVSVTGNNLEDTSELFEQITQSFSFN